MLRTKQGGTGSHSPSLWYDWTGVWFHHLPVPGQTGIIGIILTHSGFPHVFFNLQGLLGEAGPPGPKGGKGIEVTKHVTHKNTLTHPHLDFGNLFLITDQNKDAPAAAVPGSKTRNVSKNKSRLRLKVFSRQNFKE